MKMAGTRTTFLNGPGMQNVLDISLDDKMIMNYEYSRAFKDVEAVFVWSKVI
jgi:hypothetical protein